VSLSYDQLIRNNRVWALHKLETDPEYFVHLAEGQSPKYLMISCSDSRVAPTTITETEPGEMFVHRNIANLVIHTDNNVQAVLQYAVGVLKVQHVIVMGHYGCGGVQAALGHHSYPVVNPWIQNIRDLYRLYREELDQLGTDEVRFRQLVELNVREQVFNLYKTSIIQESWATERRPSIHGWVFDIATGMVKDLNISRAEWEQLEEIYRLDVPVASERQVGGH
jgi:carbonic anhydrase